ncbi:hypothetical protein [Chryseosolibacter indicus]|uniref:Uncharacterized protein n=1 Tax=Chryseosolibacter indicus TaxID=2782351 RepID=A0ABS5VYK7_9BACT|nr:hypothetical protein [Chryseosolibacter indicus]MBT1706148.1 hypothetical protein [Chryseosolibacter indicus]
MIFKQLHGKTIVARRGKPVTKESALQRENRLRFKMASRFAKAMMLDAERKAYYWEEAKKLNLPNAYTAAIADYMRKPQLKEVKVTTNESNIETNITALKKDFSINRIKVIAIGKDDTFIEDAESTDTFESWIYRFSADKEQIRKVMVIVQDNAGNVVSSTVEV